jgi:hypothetical protein
MNATPLSDHADRTAVLTTPMAHATQTAGRIATA